MIEPLRACLAGALAPEIALSRALLAGMAAAPLRAAIAAAACDTPAWRALDRLAQATPLERLEAIVREAGFDHAADTTPQAVAALFDRAVALSPEASVAFYSLGDAERLQAATDEIVAWLVRERLVDAGGSVLDFGCGIGRVAAALAPLAGSVLATDISAGMVAAAAARCGGCANVQVRQGSGDALAIADGALDLVLAVDSFPYVVQAGSGLAARMIGEFARVLRHGGALAILNFSYRGEAADRRDAAAWCAAAGLGEPEWSTPFAHWDAVVMRSSRP